MLEALAGERRAPGGCANEKSTRALIGGGGRFPLSSASTAAATLAAAQYTFPAACDGLPRWHSSRARRACWRAR